MMDIDHITDKERYDMLAEMADMYYNQGKTQAEIAKYFDTNRFRVAKLLQDARTEQIVEIKINYSNERNKVLEHELEKALPLSKAIVINTQYSPYIDSLTQVGKVGADYVTRLLEADTVIGVTWGKTIYSVISQLTTVVRNPITAVQITGYYKTSNPSVDTRELNRAIATTYNGRYCYLDAPLYVNDASLRRKLMSEPVIQEALDKTRKMDVILSGIGSRSSLPFTNPAVKPYLTKEDEEQADACIGSLYGYVLDAGGRIADIDLNQKVVSAKKEDIFATPHRLVVACGRHKTQVIAKALENRLFNELVTDSDTAAHLLEIIHN
ncbi:MAG: sugar-binding transcriptional regulator [Bariatricus sp.]